MVFASNSGFDITADAIDLLNAEVSTIKVGLSNAAAGMAAAEVSGMADPRFYDNRGPFSLAASARRRGSRYRRARTGTRDFRSCQSRPARGRSILSFFAGGQACWTRFRAVGPVLSGRRARAAARRARGMIVLPCASVSHALAPDRPRCSIRNRASHAVADGHRSHRQARRGCDVLGPGW